MINASGAAHISTTYHYSSKSERKREPYPFEVLGAMERQRSRAVIEVGKLLKNVEQMQKNGRFVS